MKKNTVHKLSVKDLISLDAFLRKQTSDMSLVKAHGFITAVASFPELYMPSDWVPVLVGELKFLHDQTPVSIMLEKLVHLYRQITTNLDSDNHFEFLLSPAEPTTTLEKATYSNIQDWCNGFCLALVWNEEAWLNIREEYITKACTTFFMLTDLINAAPDAHLATEWQKDKQILIKNLPDLVKALYVFWVGKHKAIMAKDMYNVRYEVCPCGSKKSYQSCCMMEAADAVIH
ncbi:MAG TPA: UPF0149 family protein [Gammaproteobacteria bacterium]|nr:UPF0149 family protein [Gammaproteobacteria bacterium]